MAGGHEALRQQGDERFQEAYAAVAEAVRSAFPKAEPTVESGMVAWQVPRPPAAVPDDPVGTFDPSKVVIALADRKAGPTLHVWHPGGYHLLDDNADWLREAGFQVMRGCLPWKRRSAYPRDAVHRLMEVVAKVDAAGA